LAKVRRHGVLILYCLHQLQSFAPRLPQSNTLLRYTLLRYTGQYCSWHRTGRGLAPAADLSSVLCCGVSNFILCQILTLIHACSCGASSPTPTSVGSVGFAGARMLRCALWYWAHSMNDCRRLL
jgi:hypothetical protein